MQEGTDTPNKTICTISPSLSHSLIQIEPTNTPKADIAQPISTFPSPVILGGFLQTPTPMSTSTGLETVTGRVVEDHRTKDEIIEALHVRMKHLEKENAAYQMQTATVAADRRRIDALEVTLSQMASGRSPGAGST